MSVHSSPINSTVSVRFSLGPTACALKTHTEKRLSCLFALMLMTAGYALGFIWCDGSGGHTNWFFQTAKRGVRLVGRRSRLSGWKLFVNTNNQRDFPLLSPRLIRNIASNAQIFEPWEKLRVEAWRMTEIPGQKVLSGVVVGSTTRLSVFCTATGFVAVTHSYREHLFSLFNWQTWQCWE